MSPYEFTLSDSDTKLLIVVHQNRFEAATIGEFKEGLEDVWNDKISNVVIDFEDVNFIDSSGIGALLGVQKKLRDTGSPVQLIKAKPNVISVIELLRLHRVFEISEPESV